MYYKGRVGKRIELVDLSLDVSAVFGDGDTMVIMNFPDYFENMDKAFLKLFFKNFFTVLVAAVGILFLAIKFRKVAGNKASANISKPK